MARAAVQTAEDTALAPGALASEGRVLALANQKGGVGKTTTAINLGSALAVVGFSVLILDIDPQGNASTGLGIGKRERSPSSYDALTGNASLQEAIRSTPVPGLDLLPSGEELLGVDLEWADMSERCFLLRNLMRRINEELPPYHWILIDCPPSLNLLTVNAFTAAEGVLVPLQCEFFALEGLSQLLRAIENIRNSLNPSLYIYGVLLTMMDRRNRLSEQVAEDVREVMGDRVFSTLIPRNVRLSEAPSHGRPALLYDHRCPGSLAYMRLAAELIHKEQQNDTSR
ncbi:MAG: ParA family protein [Hyphomicrobiales bacterium]|nr:ParA family protein [Hyphomicrobiales bacterium]MCY4033721.1 ParA family protein [Hyphomicrobiales bacterium]MCY4039040.1 ParA family protein [Hyphomicrobiales bacterium]